MYVRLWAAVDIGLTLLLNWHCVLAAQPCASTIMAGYCKGRTSSFASMASVIVTLPDTGQRVSALCVQALMGPSGAGKSTLMDILAMRKSTGMLAGSLLLDGQPASHAFIKLAAYVPQASHAHLNRSDCKYACVSYAVCQVWSGPSWQTAS
jgi:ABC-type uncharacterized transport system ATPase subunit